VRILVERARAEFRGNRKAYEAGFAVTTTEREAVELAVGDACDYMTTNNYANDDSYPEDAALARFLGDTGAVARECFAAIPGWFPAR
jgi:NOL1/NOP2/fmu family ribosome biogenesis protein